MSKISEFHAAVRKHFGFLQKMGFCLDEQVEANACWLTYASPNVSILLCYGPPEFESMMSFWLNDSPVLRYTVSNLVQVGQNAESWLSVPGTEGIEAHVSWLAFAVRSVQEQLCSGEPHFYDVLALASRASAAKFSKTERLRSMRLKAEAAWRGQNYTDVVALYKAESEDLSPLELRRLNYAEKISRK